MIEYEIRLPDDVWRRVDEAVDAATKAAQSIPYHSEAAAQAGRQNRVLFIAPFASPRIVLSRGDDGSQ